MIGDNLFLTRLPFSYNEAGRVVSEAVAEKNGYSLSTTVSGAGNTLYGP